MGDKMYNAKVMERGKVRYYSRSLEKHAGIRG